MGRFVMAGLLLVAIVAATVSRVRTAGGRVLRFATTPSWSVKSAELLTVPRGEPFFVLLKPGVLLLAGADGVETARYAMVTSNVTASAADLDGDGRDEIVTARGLKDTTLEAFDPQLKSVWSVGPLPRFGRPDRVVPVDLDGDGQREVVVADVDGRVAAVERSGRVRWTYALPLGPIGDQAAIRGLDDLRTEGERRVVIARRAGDLVVIGPKGKCARQGRVAVGIRRARAIDLDGDGQHEVMVGSDGGGLMVLRAGRPFAAIGATGGAAVTEIRRVEADGDPATAEVAASSKEGDVWVLSGERVLAQARVTGKISDLGVLDGDGDGAFETWIGLEEGSVMVVDRVGRTVHTLRTPGKVDRIVPVPQPGGGALAIIAAGNEVTAYRLTREKAPAWYSPITAGLVGCAMVGAVLAGLGRVRPLPPLRMSADQGLRGAGPGAARRAVERLVQAGVIRPEQAQERLEQLENPGSGKTTRRSPPPPPRSR